MKNNQVLRSLGLGALTSILKSAHAHERAHVEDEGPQKSGSEYDPGADEEQPEEVISTVTKGSKRVLPSRKQSISDLGDLFNVDNSKDSHEEIAKETDGLALHDDNIDMTTKGDSIPRPDDANHMDTEDVIFQHNDNIDMTTEDDSIPRPDEDNHMDTEDAIFQHNDNIDMTLEGDSIPRPDEETHMDTEGEERLERGVNMGDGLQRLTRARRGKLPLVLAKDAIFQHNDNIDMTLEGDSIPQPDEETHMDTEGEERLERGVNMGDGLQRLTRARHGKLPLVLAEGKV
ncbi:hypothetical protein GUJ93_ZPchr0008g11741 [Zizania palustris]|uniref:Uncharacterized protein n=1 Tax=Zizania palustris TaxID=103762 RepID=A0A8J5R737_ZIZPA|nr:hypothetical protein GUJ93_ZPchr0008g11741 [Zizania palustris]